MFDTGDLRGGAGANGKGWTGATYSGTTGIVKFASGDALGFNTGDIRGGKGDNGTNGKGWTGGTYTTATGIVSFASNDAGYAFTTGDLRGGKGLGFKTGSAYNASTGVVTFLSDDGLGFVTGDLRGASGATLTATQLSVLMNTTDHFTLNGTTSKIDFKTTYKIPTAVTADTANALTSGTSISTNTITSSGLISANNGVLANTTTVGTNDILNMRYDARNGIRFSQTYIGTDDVRYDLIQKVANVDKTTSLTFYNGCVGIGTTNPTQIFQVGSRRLRIANNSTDSTIIGTSDSDKLLGYSRIIIRGYDTTDLRYGGNGNVLYISTNTGSHIFSI